MKTESEINERILSLQKERNSYMDIGEVFEPAFSNRIIEINKEIRALRWVLCIN